MSQPRTVVVGAGIVGLCCAYELARAGHRVTVLDREPIGNAASSGNAGLFSIGHYPLTRPGAAWRGLKWMFDRTSPLWIKPSLSPALLKWLWTFHRHCDRATTERAVTTLCALGWETIAALESMLDRERIECHYERTGWLDLITDETQLDAAEAEGRSIGKFGYSTRRLSARELCDWDGAYTDRVAGAIHYTDTAILHPGMLMQSLAAAVVRAGATLRLDATVSALAKEKTGKCVGARLSTGETVEAETTLLASGIWSQELAATIGVDVPMQPARGYHIQLDGVDPLPRTGGVLHETAVAYAPMGSQLRLAGTLEIAPLGRPWMRRRLDAIRRKASACLVGVDGAHVVREWAGYRPCTGDGMPVIGFAREVPNLYIATGHAMMGLMLGPVTGKIACADICRTAPPVAADLLALVRPRN